MLLLLTSILAAAGDPLVFSGEDAAAAALRELGHTVSGDALFALSGVDPAEGRATSAPELARALRALGVDVTLTRAQPARLALQWRAIQGELAAGRPVLVYLRSGPWAVSAGGPPARALALLDGAARRSRAPAEILGELSKEPELVWLSLRTDGPLTPVTEVPPARADVARRAHALRGQLGPGKRLAWEKPFLLISDEPAATLERRRELVRWTDRMLRADFFAAQPEHLQELWILKDASSYRRTSIDLFGIDPDTPYGYYLSARRALIMNIKPGAGTLVHELVHPYMHRAWPDAPAWLNEGLASLYEFPFESGGHIKGRVNWRLPGLLRGFRAREVPSFHTLTHLTSGAFYDDPSGVHYAAARYLCFWLQERGRLPAMVRRAIELKDEDPTGFTALSEALEGEPDRLWDEWRAFVHALPRDG